MVKKIALTVLFICTTTASFIGGQIYQFRATDVARVICDSTAGPIEIHDPREPYLREVIVGCTLGSSQGPRVDVLLID